MTCFSWLCPDMSLAAARWCWIGAKFVRASAIENAATTVAAISPDPVLRIRFFMLPTSRHRQSVGLNSCIYQSGAQRRGAESYD